MDVTENGHVFCHEKPDPNRDAQNVLLAAGHDSCHSANSFSRQSSTCSDSPSARAVQADHVTLNRNLDGGYGWVVVMASFFVAFVVDGIGSSFGLLFPYILAKFGSSAFVASFAGSTFMAFAIMGSVSVMLVKTCGFRLVALVGSALSCVAFVASMFSPNIYLFIITFGVLGGCSCGLVFIPSIIIVNEYFHEKRGLANGIICSGSGVGLLVLGPVINLLLDAVSLDSTLLILAGVLLNMCVFSSLFRCPEHSRQRAASVVDSQKPACGQLAAESQSSSLCTDNVDMCLGQPADMLKAAKHETAVEAGQVVASYCSKPEPDPLHSHGRGDTANFYVQYVLHHLKPGLSAHLHHHHPSADGPGREHHLPASWNSDPHLAPIAVQDHHSYSMFDIPTWCQDKDRHQVLQYLQQRFKHFGDHRRLHQPHRTGHGRSQNISIDQASNCYLAGSIATLISLHNSFVHAVSPPGLKSIHSLNSMSSKLHDDTEHSGDTLVTSEQLLAQNAKDGDTQTCMLPHQQHEARASGPAVARSGYTGVPADDPAGVSVQSELDLPLGYTMAQLLCMPSFHLFCLGAALIQIGYPLAGTFLADYAYQFGLTTSHTAVLMSLLGGMNVCGRLLAGSLVSLKMDPLFLNNLSLLLGGLACLLSPLYSQFWSLCLFAGMFGFFLGFFPPLQPLIIVKHFGLSTLASAFGFLSTVKGVASVLGAPLAGFIYDVTGQYSMSFVFGGAVFVLSCLVHCLISLSDRCCRRKPRL